MTQKYNGFSSHFSIFQSLMNYNNGLLFNVLEICGNRYDSFTLKYLESAGYVLCLAWNTSSDSLFPSFHPCNLLLRLNYPCHWLKHSGAWGRVARTKGTQKFMRRILLGKVNSSKKWTILCFLFSAIHYWSP